MAILKKNRIPASLTIVDGHISEDGFYRSYLRPVHVVSPQDVMGEKASRGLGWVPRGGDLKTTQDRYTVRGPHSYRGYQHIDIITFSFYWFLD